MKQPTWRIGMKLLVLMLLDVGTLGMAMIVWQIFSVSFFPLILLQILFALFALNIMTLMPIQAAQRLHIVSPGSLWLVTLLYFLLVMLSTWLSYRWVTAKMYGILSLLLLAAYLISVKAMHTVQRRRTRRRNNSRRVQSQTVQMLVLNLSAALDGLQTVVETRQYAGLCRAYDALRVQVERSTPFGHSDMPVVGNMEECIADRLSRLTKLVWQAEDTPGEEAVSQILSELLYVTELVKNREKRLMPM